MKEYDSRGKGPGTMNFDIPSRSFTVILLIILDFQHFLPYALRYNPYIIELIPIEFLVETRRHKRKKTLFTSKAKKN